MGLTHEQIVEHLHASSEARWAATPRSPRPSRAVMTIVHDEAFFLPLWLDYYSRHFDADDIYVLDHDTSDGSTDGPGFHRIPVSHDGVDHEWMAETVMSLQHELVERYDVVLFTDVDEFVATDPRRGELGDLIDRLDTGFVQCQGYELIHRPDLGEAPFDPDRPILDQRAWWFPNAAYNKPLLATGPMNWIPGFHGVREGTVALDDHLYLIHLHRLDHERCRQRHALRRTRRWAPSDLERGYAAHNLLDTGDDFDSWFFGRNSMDDEPIKVEPIPSHWKGLF